MKYLCRGALLLALAAMSYIALLPAYDFTNWVPEPFLRSLGISDSFLEALVNHADKLAHTFGALIISLLYFLSLTDSKTGQPNPFKISSKTFLLLLLLIAVTAEIIQLGIGRNFSLGDILAGLLGGAMALAMLSLLKQKGYI